MRYLRHEPVKLRGNYESVALDRLGNAFPKIGNFYYFVICFLQLIQPKILQPVNIVIIRVKVYKIRKYRKSMYVPNKQMRRRNDVSGFEWISVARMYSGNSLLKVNLSKLTRFFKLVVCICHCHVFMSCFIPTFNFSSLL